MSHSKKDAKGGHAKRIKDCCVHHDNISRGVYRSKLRKHHEKITKEAILSYYANDHVIDEWFFNDDNYYNDDWEKYIDPTWKDYEDDPGCYYDNLGDYDYYIRESFVLNDLYYP